MEDILENLLFPSGNGTVYAVDLEEEVVMVEIVEKCYTVQDLEDRYDITLYALTYEEAKDLLEDYR